MYLTELACVANEPALNSYAIYLNNRLKYHRLVLPDIVQQYQEPHIEVRPNQHTKQLHKDGGGHL